MSADIDKKIASIVRKELKNENYDDDCWLKAFKKAGGDENKAKVLYIDIRTNDLKKIAEKEKIAEDLKTNTYAQCGRAFCNNKYQVLLIPKKSLGVQLCEGCGNTLDQKVNEKSALREIEQRESKSESYTKKNQSTYQSAPRKKPGSKMFYSNQYGWSFPGKYILLAIPAVIGIIYFENQLIIAILFLYLIGCVIGFFKGDR